MLFSVLIGMGASKFLSLCNIGSPSLITIGLVAALYLGRRIIPGNPFPPGLSRLPLSRHTR
jgi:hypothetical protein